MAIEFLAGTAHHGLAGVIVCLWLVASPLFFPATHFLLLCLIVLGNQGRPNLLNYLEVTKDRVKVVRNYLELVPVED